MLDKVTKLRILNKNGKLSAFINAGVSASCGLPDWQTLRRKIEAELLNYDQKIYYENNEIEDIARIKFGNKFNSIIAKLLYEEEIVISNQIILLARSGIEKIVNFNFDDLLEEALISETIDHNVILNGENFSANYNGLLMFHPHGFLERFSSESKLKKSNIIISKRDYENLYGNHYCLTNIIQLSILITNSVLFIGMSLNDPNILRLLKISRNLGARHWHTAIIKKFGSKIENERINSKFRFHGVEPLWVNSYDSIEIILKKIRVSKKFNSAQETMSTR